jgi:hypothetical protein
MVQDQPWKEIIADLFEEFLHFFFPQIHSDIDFSAGYEFLDHELHKLAKDNETGRRLPDKLVKVFLRDGAEKWLLVHIEVQSYEQAEFAERMFVYNYRIFDKFGKETISLALLTDDNPEYRPAEYYRARWGCELCFRYPVVKIIDYRAHWEEIESQTHPFALVVMAYLKALDEGTKVQERYAGKKHFLLELYRQGMSRETVSALYRFIDWIMTLPDELEITLLNEIKSIEEATSMVHLTSAERLGLKRGIEQGIQQGIQQTLPAIYQAVEAILEIKFGESGLLLSGRARNIRSVELLQRLTTGLKHVHTLPEAEELLADLESQNH